MIRKLPQISVFYDATHLSSREAVNGIIRYANTFGPWLISLNEIHVKPRQPLSKNCSGIIACLPPPDIMKTLAESKCPVVLINPMRYPGKMRERTEALAHVRSESWAFGVTAAEFFLARMPRTYVYVGKPEAEPWDCERGEAFAARIRKAGYNAYLYPPDGKPVTQTSNEIVDLQKWLGKLPKPLAIFAANDMRARQVLDACLLAGIAVPYEATILGVDDDKWLCESTRPSLSSIPFDAEESGFLAAQMLDGLMRHKADPKTVMPQLVKILPPRAVVERESTEDRNISDTVVAKALAFIYLNKGLDIRATDVAAAVGYSLNWIEILFRRELKSSVIDEINRARLKTVQQLINETTTPFQEIARRCGFTNPSTLCRIVKKATGKSMRELRTGHR